MHVSMLRRCPGKLSLWLRCVRSPFAGPKQVTQISQETKPFEARAALSPSIAAKLIANGFEVIVERDPQRIFEDFEYEK
jgi:hypothetical protein